MKLKKIVILLSVLALFSCNKKEQVQGPETSIVEKNNAFNVIIKAIVKKDDKFQLYYTDETSPSFKDEKSVWAEIKGSEGIQEIMFYLPEDDLPTNFRIDLGTNKDQHPILIKSISFNYFDKSKVLESNNILTYFVHGDVVLFNPETGEIDFTKISKDNYDPQLYPQDNLKEELSKLIK